MTGNVTMQPPSGSPVNGQEMTIRLSSSNALTGRTIAWSTATGGYAAGLAPSILPAVNFTGKRAMVKLVYVENPAPAKWRSLIGMTGA